PLWQHVMVNRQIYDLYRPVSGKKDEKKFRLNQQLLSVVRAIRETRGDGRQGGNRNQRGRGRGRYDRRQRGRRGGSRGGSRPGVPSRAGVLTRLHNEDLFPAIIFVFSRAGCDGAVAQVAASDLRLTSHHERREIREIVEARCAD